MSVKEILKGLDALQNVDLQILDLQRTGEVYPKRLAELDAKLGAARAAVDAERARLSDNEKTRREKETEVASEKDKVKKWEGRLAEMRTTREYAALAREIDIAKKAILNIEEEHKALLESFQGIKKGLEIREGELLGIEDSTGAERANLSEKIGALASQVCELGEKRAEVAKGVDPELVSRYDYIRKKRGAGLVPVVNGICKGCNMRIPPQLHNILRSGATLEACPSCQRLIYAEEAVKEG